MTDSDKIIVFQDKEIRRIWENNEWYFSIVDIVAMLTDSPDPRKYWHKVKKREFIDLQLSPIWRQLKLPSADGKRYKTDCATAQAMFRIIQSIPSPKAEPFKRWLAAIGAERIREIADPEIAALRAQDLYRKKGYPDDWIALRARGVATRAELIANGLDTDEICANLGADSLGYISLDGMIAATRQPAQGLCTACFSGKYPIPVEGPGMELTHTR